MESFEHSPPPLPGRERSFAPVAGLLSVMAPIVAVILVVSFWGSGPVTANFNKALGAVCFFLTVSGITLGVIALCAVERQGRKNILGRSILGLVLNGFFIVACLAGFFQQAKRKADQRAASFRNLQDEVKRIQEDTRKSFNRTNGITGQDSQQLSRLKSMMEDSSKNVSGDEGLVFKAGAMHVGNIEAAAKPYHLAVKELQQTKPLDMSLVKSREELGERKAVVRRFIEANDNFTKVIARSETSYREELIRLKASDQVVEKAMAGFRKSARLGLLIEIRGTDARLGAAMLGALELMERGWGQWKYNEAREKIIFQNTADVEAFNGFMAEMSAASKDQIAVQERLVNLK